VSESAEIWIRDPIGVPRCSPQSGTPYTSMSSESHLIQLHNTSNVTFPSKFKVRAGPARLTGSPRIRVSVYENSIGSVPKTAVKNRTSAGRQIRNRRPMRPLELMRTCRFPADIHWLIRTAEAEGKIADGDRIGDAEIRTGWVPRSIIPN
jgi:hypothetical protein